MTKQKRKRFLKINQAPIIECLRYKTSVKQMKYRMLSSTNTCIHRQPLFHYFPIKWLSLIKLSPFPLTLNYMWIRQKVPRTIQKGVRYIYLPGCLATTHGTLSHQPLTRGISQRSCSISLRLIIIKIGQHHRQLTLINRLPATLITLHHRNWWPPVSLPTNHPISQVIVNLFYSRPFFFQVL